MVTPDSDLRDGVMTPPDDACFARCVSMPQRAGSPPAGCPRYCDSAPVQLEPPPAVQP